MICSRASEPVPFSRAVRLLHDPTKDVDHDGASLRVSKRLLFSLLSLMLAQGTLVARTRGWNDWENV